MLLCAFACVCLCVRLFVYAGPPIVHCDCHRLTRMVLLRTQWQCLAPSQHGTFRVPNNICADMHAHLRQWILSIDTNVDDATTPGLVWFNPLTNKHTDHTAPNRRVFVCERQWDRYRCFRVFVLCSELPVYCRRTTNILYKPALSIHQFPAIRRWSWNGGMICHIIMAHNIDSYTHYTNDAWYFRCFIWIK